jgi:hypothetical protein
VFARGRYRTPMFAAALAWSLLLLVANGRVPYVRVWMFLLPYALVDAAGGLAVLAHLTTQRAGFSMRRIATLAVMGGATAIASWQTLRSGAVQQAEDTGTLRDGAAIATFLLETAGPRDRVIASAPSDLPLAYQLTRRAGSATLLRATPDSAPRLWIVVNDMMRQREADLVGAAEIVTRDFGSPRLVRRFREASVYLRERERPGCVLDPSVCR